MANNRMFLICNVCYPPGNNNWPRIDSDLWKRAFLHIAKWYPVSPYYPPDGGESLGKRIEQFLIDHHHPEVATEQSAAGAGQENPVRLEYEWESLPKP